MRVIVAVAILLSLPVSSARAQSADDAREGWFGRSDRLALSLGFGVGTIANGGFDDLATDFEGVFARQGATLSDTPASGRQINSEFAVRYYFAYHVMAQVGYGALYSHKKVDASVGGFTGSVESHNVVMEVPVLVGAHYPVAKRVSLHAAAGPSFFFFSRSYWDADPGDVNDFKADGGTGFHVLVGADLFASESFAAGLEVRYRSLQGNDLRDLDTGIVVTSGLLRGDGSNDTYPIDYSGVSVGLSLRLFVM